MALPLEHIRILDVGTLTPGKYCTFILGDLGAEVIRVERPISTDAPEADRLPDEDLILNRNKRSITLNLKADAARQVFYRLSEEADVILESYRPGLHDRTRRPPTDSVASTFAPARAPAATAARKSMRPLARFPMATSLTEGAVAWKASFPNPLGASKLWPA